MGKNWIKITQIDLKFMVKFYFKRWFWFVGLDFIFMIKQLLWEIIHRHCILKAKIEQRVTSHEVTHLHIHGEKSFGENNVLTSRTNHEPGIAISCICRCVMCTHHMIKITSISIHFLMKLHFNRIIWFLWLPTLDVN